MELHEEKESYLEGQLAAIYRGKSGLLAEEADGGGRRPGSVQKEREILLPGMTRKSDLTEVCCLRYERKQGHGHDLGMARRDAWNSFEYAKEIVPGTYPGTYPSEVRTARIDRQPSRNYEQLIL